MWNIEGFLISFASRGYTAFLVFGIIAYMLWCIWPIVRKPSISTLQRRYLKRPVATFSKIAFLFVMIIAVSSLSTYRPRLGTVTGKGFPGITAEEKISVDVKPKYQSLKEQMVEEGHEQSKAVRDQYYERKFYGAEEKE